MDKAEQRAGRVGPSRTEPEPSAVEDADRRSTAAQI